MSDKKRASFGGKLSAILVAAGSAIGLGSIWRFPYLAGEHGGAAFLLVYLLCVLAHRLEEELMAFLVRKPNDLVLDARAIARARALYHTRIER